jgi:ATP-dependent protease HslVU (ClpYQ) peptidase subunit
MGAQQMTIIAYRAGVIAADSCATDSFITCADKLYKKNGAVIGFCGEVAQALVFVDWYFNQKKSRRPDLASEQGWEAMVLTKQGVFIWERSLRPVPMGEEFYAIGSGAPLAMGAMEYGASASEAVSIACRRDPYCREPVVVQTL